MLLEYLLVIRRGGFAAKGYGIARSFSTVWFVGSLAAMPKLLPGDDRAVSAHVRSGLVGIVGDWLPLWGASPSYAESRFFSN